MNYKEILENILKNGIPKQSVRFDSNNNPIPVENGTIGTFCEIFRHDMSQGFPLTTLRKMPFKSMCVELEGFIKGVTDKRWYQERGCKFWDEWANPQHVNEITEVKNNPESKNEHQKLTHDLGPIYGYQWRKFNKEYKDGTIGNQKAWFPYDNGGDEKGTDQLRSIVDKLKTNPYDRRMVCSAWNPNQIHLMALPSCHVLHQVVVYGNKLNLTWFQRSCDSTHGVPNNIASYALLLMLYCEESGLEPGELVGVLSDCHVYENTIEAAKELVSRQENKLPTIKIKRKNDGSFSIFEWTWDEVELIDYNPHPPIDMGKVTV